MSSTAEQMRAWNGPALLSFGFRPFFLLGAIWAAVAMAIWIFMLSGRDPLPTAFDAVSWHAHEFLFGYLGAVMAGFLLTAVPNWTGRLPVVGKPLALLVALWIIGRIAIAVSGWMPWAVAAMLDLAFPLALLALLGREIVSGKNWKNLIVLGLIGLWALANLGFHMDAAQGGYPAQGAGLRFGLAAAVMLISVIGGRIVPSFTRNWLVQQREQRLPAPMGKGDRLVLFVSGFALLLWALWPDQAVTALACGLVGAAHLWRLSRWQGWLCGREALVWVLHAGYAFVPLGFLAIAGGYLLPEMAAAAQHLWMAGAIGLMTLAVMTRASLGHSGRPLHATKPIAALYIALIVAVLARFASGALPGEMWPLHLAGTAWILAFGGFAVIYAPMLALARPVQKRAMPRKTDAN